MSYLKNMVNVMSSVEIIPSDTLYIPNPSLLIVSSLTTSTVANKLFDAGVTVRTRQFVTDGASVVSQINCSTEDFLLSSTLAQANNIQAGAGVFIEKSNVANNTTDGTVGTLTGPPDAGNNKPTSSTLLVDNNNFPTGKNVEIYSHGFVSRLGVSVGDIVYNRTDKTSTSVTAVNNDQDLSVANNIMATNEVYEIYSANPPQAATGAAGSGAGAQGCLVYVGTSTQFVQDINNDPTTPGVPVYGQGTNDPRHVNIKVKTAGGQDITFNNFPVGEVLPVQVVQVYATPAITNASLIALW